jgi:hypothetical protein
VVTPYKVSRHAAIIAIIYIPRLPNSKFTHLQNESPHNNFPQSVVRKYQTEDVKVFGQEQMKNIGYFCHNY